MPSRCLWCRRPLLPKPLDGAVRHTIPLVSTNARLVPGPSGLRRSPSASSERLTTPPPIDPSAQRPLTSRRCRLPQLTSLTAVEVIGASAWAPHRGEGTARTPSSVAYEIA